MANRHQRVHPTSTSTGKDFLSKAACRSIRRAVALADELNLLSSTASGVVWHLYFTELIGLFGGGCNGFARNPNLTD